VNSIISHQRRRVRPRALAARIGPWTLSLLLHLGLIAAGFAVTWSIIRYEERLPSPVAVSNVVTLTPTVPLQSSPAQPSHASLDGVLPEMSAHAAPPAIAGPAPSRATIRPPATFAGSSLQAARDVVFVVDASGSMMAWVHSIVDEVERTLRGMADDQRFAVLCFAGDSVWQVPARGLVAATPAIAREAVAELRSGIGALSGFGSDPVAAMGSALALRPDLIMLLSEGIEGRGRFTVDREAAMQALDRLNPLSASGGRPVSISCIQLVVGDNQSPAVLMMDIAASHGGMFNTITSEEFDP